MKNEHGFAGFAQIEFEFEGRAAILVCPDRPEPARNWLLKTEYWGAFPELELEMVRRGYHLAYLKNTSRFAPQTDCDAKARFVDYLHRTYGLRDRCVPVGMSCGGAHAVVFAGTHPECVACLYLDAPVLNYCDFPGRLGDAACERVWAQEFLQTYPGMTRAKLLRFDRHPMNYIDVLQAHRIPVLMLYGTQDETVRYDCNGRWLAEAYRDRPELLTVIPRVAQGHHPHGACSDPMQVVDFIRSHCT